MFRMPVTTERRKAAQFVKTSTTTIAKAANTYTIILSALLGQAFHIVLVSVGGYQTYLLEAWAPRAANTRLRSSPLPEA